MKKFIKVTLPIIVLVALFFGVKHLNKPAESDGSKKDVTINISVSEDDDLETLFNLHFETEEALTLGDLIDEINGETVNFELDGDKASEFGRFIAGINEYKTEDMDKGPWWMLYSDNNKDCLEAGFCSGIDSQLIYDEDIFDFVFE
ncbi:MAG TPA: hypothetical protein VFC75_03830 [Erysipelothrix sp.]|nr:hypothetical protein [Erysipelothrix sp.]